MSYFRKNKVVLRIACFFVTMSFLSSAVMPAYVRAQDLMLPAPTQFVNLTNPYSFPILKGMKFDPKNPLEMEFIIDTADQRKVSEDEASRLIKYFLAGLTMPDNELWVNMSPYEEDKIINPSLSETDLGKDMLSQDYILKQLSASLTYPDSNIGKDYWTKTYAEVQKVAKTTKLPVNTFNKIWILPDKAEVYENGNLAVVSEATLKTLLEQDYLALKNNVNAIQKQKKGMQEDVIQKVNEASSKVLREMILPKINTEVNSGKNFATLRQIYYSLIMAAWFKAKFKDSIYKHYINQGKVFGIDLNDKDSKDKIYNLYVEAFKKGLYNYIKSDYDPSSHRNIKRQYFSGGELLAVHPNVRQASSSALNYAATTINGDLGGPLVRNRISLKPEGAESPIGGQGKTIAASPLQLKVRTIDDMKRAVAGKNIDSGFAVVDWNVPVEEGKVANDLRIQTSLPTLEKALTDLSLQYLFVATHSGRPKGKGYEEAFSLKPMVEKAKELLKRNDVTIVLLPYDLAEADKKITEAKQAFIGKKIIFVFDNIRFYPEEKAKDAKVRKAFEEKLISLTGAKPENLVYINEASAKIHRGQESSMEMVHLFPVENRAAGITLQEEINKSIAFEKGVTGSHNAVFGGAKFDKFENVGEIADKIEKTGGQMIVIGALANPLLAALGKDMGKSLMPKDSEAQDVRKAIDTIVTAASDEAQAEEDYVPLKVLTSPDFKVEGKSEPQTELSGNDRQVDIGPQGIAILKSFFESLKPGDGVIINGGAGIFENPESREGTTQLILLAYEAAKRGVLVFSAGGDMDAAIKIVEKDRQMEISKYFISSEGGGSLLQTLGKGMMALPALSALVVSEEPETKVPATTLVKSFLEEALPGAIILEPSLNEPKDTFISEGNRAARLDLRPSGKGVRVEVPQAENPDELTYGHYGTIPVIIPNKALGRIRALKIKLGKKEINEKNVTQAIIAYIQEKAYKVGLPFMEEQGRSHLLEDKGDFALDKSSAIAVYPQVSGDLLMEIPFWAKDTKIIDDLRSIFASEKELTELPSDWDKNVTISNSTGAFDFMVDNGQRFFEEFKKGNFESLPLFTKILNTLNPQDLFGKNIDGIEYDPVLGVFISQKDKDAPEKFMGSNFKAFMLSMDHIVKLVGDIYFNAANSINKDTGKPVVIGNLDLQKSAISFYYRMYKTLDNLAVMHFKDIQVFEPLRRQIGIYANALNNDLRNDNAIDVNAISANDLIKRLVMQKIDLSTLEINNIKSVYSDNNGEAIWYDILQLSEVLSENNFIEVFSLIKVGASKEVKAENRTYEAYDGTGRIGRIALAFRLADDIRRQSNNEGYLGRYLIRSRSLDGASVESKFKFAEANLKKMLNDDVIKASDLSVLIENAPVRFSQLLADGRITFAAQDKVLSAKQDLKNNEKVASVYPVNILLDGKTVGVAYYLDTNDFTEGLRAQGVDSYNIPRPLVVSDSKDFYFGTMLDATPGGVEIAGMTQDEAKKKGIKLSGKSAMEMVASDKVEIENYQLDAANELKALRGVAEQVAKNRLPKGKNLTYVKTQIFKKLLPPLGGGLNLSSAFVYKLPRIQDGGMRILTPTSCSTNGATYLSLYLSMFAGLGEKVGSLLGLTYHMYTGGDKVGPFGHLKAGSTGAANGVKQHLPLEGALFTSVRVPTAFKNGETDILGGSAFDLLVQFPFPVKKQVLIDFLKRVSVQFPEHIRIFDEDSKKSGAYRWKDTITGQSTGSIVYPELIKQMTPTTFRIFVGYDNEWSYSTQMDMLVRSLDELGQRGNDKAKRFQKLSINPINRDSTTQKTFDKLLSLGSDDEVKATIGGLNSESLAKLNDYAKYMTNAADILASQGQTFVYTSSLKLKGKQILDVITNRLRTEALNRASDAKRTPIIGGNWKMALGSRKEAKQLLLQVAKEVKDTQGVDVVVAPSFVHLETVAGALHELEVQGEIPIGLIKLAAQNMYAEEKGAFTGGMSAAQLKDLGVTYVILGHSELRRNSKQELTGESDANVNRKVKAALNNRLTPIVCVGESWPEREAGKTNELVGAMIDNSLAGLTSEEAAKIVVAYEPVWAIGTGKSATPEQAEEIHYFIRGKLLDNFGEDVASIIPIQYGGSVDSTKIAGLIAKPDIDGGLVGGASLKPKDFGGIIKGTEKALNMASSALVPIKRVGILTGGGPASGHNQVIYSVVKEAEARGIEVIAISQGWKGLMSDELVEQARLLTLMELDGHRTKGGTIIKTERKNPYGKKEKAAGVPDTVWANIQKLQLDALLGLGGDDTASVSYWLQQDHPDFPVLALPKTMDNDMPLPDNASTYGFDSFTEAATKAVQDGIVDAKSTSRVLVVESFGRKAGFAPLRIGANVEASRTIIPEEKRFDLEKFINNIRSYHKKHGYAVVIVSEGVKISENIGNNKAILEKVFAAKPLAGKAYELAKEAQVDDFGNPKLEYAGMIIAAILEVGLKEDGIKISNAGKLDYLFRSVDTSKVDLAKCKLLGKAAIEYLVNGEKNKLLYDHDGEVRSMDLVQNLGGRKVDHKGTHIDEFKKANQALFADEALASSAIAEMLQGIGTSIQFNAKTNTFDVIDEGILRNRDVDYLARESAFSANIDVKKSASRLLMEVGEGIGIHSSSMHDLYQARKEGKVLVKATVPANNIRGMAFDTIKTAFDVAIKHNGFVIFEIAKSEIGYTKQPLYEYSAQVYAAAIKAGYKGKIFMQLDHAQYDKVRYFGFKGKSADPEGARQEIVDLVDQAIDARVYNIDVDPSSLMIAGNLKKQDATNPELKEIGAYDLEELTKEDALNHLSDEEILLRQTFNIRETAYLTNYIRNKEKTLGLPLTIAIGGEDMHVDQNVLSTGRSVKLFAGALEDALDKLGVAKGKGVTKISVQSGTGHGGITIAGVPGDKGAVKIDMATLQEITALAEAGELGSTIAGVVQHGASTVPEEYFSEFSENDVIEVHLATGYQNQQLKAILEHNPMLYQKINESMVKSKLWDNKGELGEIKKAIQKYLANYYKKAYGENIPEELYHSLFKKAGELVETQKDWASFTKNVHQEVAGLAQFGGKIQKDEDMIMRFAVAEAFYRSYKKVFGLEKEALWNMDDVTKQGVYKAVYDNFEFIWTNLGFTDTLKVIDPFTPVVPINVTPRPVALQEAVASSAISLKDVEAWETFDSRNNPTVAAKVSLTSGTTGETMVPSGASTGSREALELRDKKTYKKGKGVYTAINNVNTIIADAIKGTISDTTEIVRTVDDKLIELDGTEYKSKLGANAILGASMATTVAAAKEEGKPLYRFLNEELKRHGVDRKMVLPVPMFNILNAGAHTEGTEKPDIQEYMIMPVGAETFAQALEWGMKVYAELGKILDEKGLGPKDAKDVGNEKGYQPALKTNEEGLELITEAIRRVGLKPGKDVGIKLTLDVAASEFYNEESKTYNFEKKDITAKEMVEFYKKMVDKYPIISIEDGLAENDWDGWKLLTEELGNKVQLVGDDLYVTNPKIFKKGISEGIANAILIKLNQIGTVSETLETIKMAVEAGYGAVISHRSGETEDTFIADLAVAAGLGQIKTGAPYGFGPDGLERMVKYWRLAEIEKDLGSDAVYAGKMFNELVGKGNGVNDTGSIAANSSVEASTSSSAIDNPGGIDLGDIGVKAAPGSSSSLVDFSTIDLSKIRGFSFKIISIEPIMNPGSIFGIFPKAENKKTEEQQLAYLKN